MRKHRTAILGLLVFLSLCSALAAYARSQKSRATAQANELELLTVHRDLTDIAQANAGLQISVGKLDSAELTRRLGSAAVIAGVRDQLVDIDPNPPTRIGSSDYNELTIILRFERITLRQLTIFFQQLAVNDPGSRAKSLELAPPEASGSLGSRSTAPAVNTGEELWTADVTVAYLILAPKEAKTAR